MYEEENQQSGYDQNEQSEPIPVYSPPPPQYAPPQYPPPPQYAPPQYSPPQPQYGTMQWPHMKVGNWLVSMLLMLIPVANIVLVFVWAFGSDVNPSKKSFFQAYLILMLISIVIGTILGILFGAIILAVLSDAFYGIPYMY